MGSRSFMLGLGLGLIVSAGFLFAVQKPSEPSASWTREELQAAAQQLQLVLVPKEEYEQMKKGETASEQMAKEPKSPGEPLPPAAKGEKTPAQAKQPGVPAPPQTSEVKEASAKTAVTTPQSEAPRVTEPPVSTEAEALAAPASAEATEPAEAVSIRIPGATNATKVGKLFAEAGLIPSAEQLVQELRTQQKQNRIRAGTYQIEKGTSVQEIVKLITTPPPR